MLTFRGGAPALLLALTALVALLLPAAPARAQETGGAIVDLEMTLGRDGVLDVTERVTVPPGGRFTMSLPLRVQISENSERRFAVTDIEVTGPGTAEVADDLFTVDAGPGESTFRYSVQNTVSDADGSQVFRWFGVLNVDIAEIHASLISPSFEMGIVDCVLGPLGATRPCAQVHIEPDGVLYLDQTNLRKGESVDLTLQIPPGTVPANADITGPGASAFAITGPVVIAFVVLLLALIVLALYLFLVRRQSVPAAPMEPLDRSSGRTLFSSPAGILPGEAGVLLDGYADPTDIAATVVDLAVRNYLWIGRIGEDEWRIVRVNPADDQLRGYERVFYDALLPAGVPEVTMAELRVPGRLPVEPLRRAMVADAVDRGAFIDPARRRIPLWLGGGLIVLGAAVTVVAALLSGHALVGVAIALAGGALLGAQKFLPVRTAYGRTLTGQVRGLQRGLEQVRSTEIPSGDRELVFSRGLPYMVVWSRADNWVRAFRDIDPSDDDEPGLYWFGGFDDDRDLHRFAVHFPYFITAVETLFPAK
ncbi:DUF2207 domain-containing protein [Nocardia sp. NPDC024068]|uniref:DUF2207 domain-containing protein n=1 Tax=Nocardia sp. NPDC024068 TaxID=3157197 RepID=UPI003409005A